jgi:large subunit ribosomal protein L17
MRHLKSGRKLGRNASHRTALLRNLACALIAHEQIVTTVAKAKELRPFVERLITLAKRGTLHARRLIIARLGGNRSVVITKKDEEETVWIVQKLFTVLAPRYADRPGGYTRIIKRSKVRLGDAGPTAFVQLLAEGETKAKRPTAPAPKVTEPEEREEREETPPAEGTQTPPPEGEGKEAGGEKPAEERQG